MMTNDYRKTRYWPELCNIEEKKRDICAEILKDHPHATNMHRYISDNSKNYKKIFLKAYNSKCAYCGVSIDLLRVDSFEIDHYIYKQSAIFHDDTKNPGNISNLVLACHDCNHNKGSFEITNKNYELFNPDKEKITEIFFRDDDYYIQISDDYIDNIDVKKFYDKLRLGSLTHRIDFLLMNMYGFRKQHETCAELYNELSKMINYLQKKRNQMYQ